MGKSIEQGFISVVQGHFISRLLPCGSMGARGLQIHLVCLVKQNCFTAAESNEVMAGMRFTAVSCVICMKPCSNPQQPKIRNVCL